MLPGAGHAGLDPLDDDRSLELGEHAEHLVHRLARGCDRVQALLVQVGVDLALADLVEDTDQILHAPPQLVDRSSGHHVDLTEDHRLQEPVQRRPLASAIGSGDALVGEAVDHLPAEDTDPFGSGAGGEVRYVQTNNTDTTNDYTVIYRDLDSDVGSECQIELRDLVDLSSTDFLP